MIKMYNRICRVLGLLHLCVNATWDVVNYPLRRELGQQTWQLLLQMHCRTNGRSTAMLRRIVQKCLPPRVPIRPFNSMLGQFDADSIREIVKQIRRDGFYVFSATIPASLCDNVTAEAIAMDGWGWRDSDGLHTLVKFEPNRLAAPRYELPEKQIWQISAYQRIIADPIFVNLSQNYFSGVPALKEAGLWWSTAIDDKTPDEDAAQLFHFDYDAAPIWLKFFIYLNDVTPSTGPHVFVRGSHRLASAQSRPLLSRGYVRIADRDIISAYGAENVIEMTGVKGTVFAVDTMGFHKGKVPLEGHRVIAQLEFATPLFVAALSKPLPLPANVDPQLMATRNKYPWAFTRFPVRVS